jgi:hypothetical protein
MFQKEIELKAILIARCRMSGVDFFELFAIEAEQRIVAERLP